MPKLKKVVKQAKSVKRKVNVPTLKRKVTPTPKKITPIRKERIDDNFGNATLSLVNTLSISITPKQNKSLTQNDWLYKVALECHPKSFTSRKESAKESKQWNKDDFEITSIIGRGKFGCVYKATENTSADCPKPQYALKILQKDKVLECDRAPRLLRREVEIHSRLRHENIIKCHGYFHSSDSIYFVMEQAYGDFYHQLLLKEPGQKLQEYMAANYIQQIASALDFIHEQCIYHRDLKPENILCSNMPSSNGNTITKIKLCDFGWAIFAPKKFIRKTFCGTPEYLAPELLRRSTKQCSHSCQYDVRFVDAWALGVMAIEMLDGYTPFDVCFTSRSKEKVRDEIFSKVRSFRKVSVKYKQISLNFYDFVSRTMTKDFEKRMPMKEVLDHPWIVSNVNNITMVGPSLSF